MGNDNETRKTIAKGIVGSGLTLVGLATGSNPLFSLLISSSVNIGANLLSEVTDKAIINWQDQWLSRDGVGKNAIKSALLASFKIALQRLCRDWENSHEYHHLVYKKEFERAKFSLILLDEFRADTENIFQENESFDNFVAKNLLIYGEKSEINELVRNNIAQFIDKYMGAMNELCVFTKQQLPSLWIISFTEYLESDSGREAWKECQFLWQKSLMTTVIDIQGATSQTGSDVGQIKDDLSKVLNWLAVWEKQLSNPKKNSERESRKLLNEVDTLLNDLREQLNIFTEKNTKVSNILEEIFNELDIDANKVISNFIQKELLNDQYVNLKQAGHGVEIQEISLAKVFVDLPISKEYFVEPPSDNQDHEGFAKMILEISKLHLDTWSINSGKNALRNEQKIIESANPGKFVLIGGPGQGKSTITQFICQLFRASILHNSNESISGKVNQALGEIDILCRRESLSLPEVQRLPFRIVLNDFAAKLSDKQNNIHSVLDYIVDKIRVRTNQDISTNTIRHWLGRYPWLVIFDGLDEVPISSNRDQVLSAIDEFEIDTTGLNSDILIVATTRPQGYNREFSAEFYSHQYLSPLPKHKAKHYAERLIDSLYGDEKDRKEKVLERLNLALDENSTVRLMRSPLQVTIMTTLVEKVGKPPQERWSLFSKYYSIIYDRETERNLQTSNILSKYKAHIDAIHHSVGLILQIESDRSGKTGAHMSHDRFAQVVETRLVDEGYDGTELTSLKNKIIEAAIDRLVFLVGVNENEIGFEIRSFQEFMASEAIMDCKDELVNKRLLEIATPMSWRNVFLFAAGKCFSERQHLRETIQGICAVLNESDVSVNGSIDHILLSGSRLALDLLEDGLTQHQPKYFRSFLRLAMRLMDLPLTNYQIRLANLYSVRYEDVFREELEIRLKGSFSISYRGAWFTLLNIGVGAGWAREYFTTYFPREEQHKLYLVQLGSLAQNFSLIDENFLNLILRMMFDSYEDLNCIRVYANLDIAPHWLKNISDVPVNKKNTITEINFLGTKAEPSPLSVGITKVTSKTNFPDLKNLPNPSPYWLPLVSASRFIENPSMASLKNELIFLRENGFDEHLINSQSTNELYFNYLKLPWVLETILETIIQEKSFNLLQKLSIDTYGDINQWILAEERWIKNGITQKDLTHLKDEHWPFDNKIELIGFPVNSMYAFVRVNESEIYKLLEEIIDIIPYCERKTRADLYKICSFLIGMIGRYEESHIKLKEFVLGDYFFDLFDQSYFHWQQNLVVFLASILSRKISNDERNRIFDIIDTIGRTRLFRVNSRSIHNVEEKEVVNNLLWRYVAHPDMYGLLVVLSHLISTLIKADVPKVTNNFFNVELAKDNRHEEAMIIYKVCQMNYSEELDNQTDEISVLVSELVNFYKKEKGILIKVLTAISIRKQYNKNIEKFLFVLRRQVLIPDGKEFELFLDILETLNANRTCSIVSQWKELDFPLCIGNLLVPNIGV